MAFLLEDSAEGGQKYIKVFSGDEKKTLKNNV
jgi:hypothetical protein